MFTALPSIDSWQLNPERWVPRHTSAARAHQPLLVLPSSHPVALKPWGQRQQVSSASHSLQTIDSLPSVGQSAQRPRLLLEVTAQHPAGRQLQVTHTTTGLFIGFAPLLRNLISLVCPLAPRMSLLSRRKVVTDDLIPWPPTCTVGWISQSRRSRVVKSTWHDNCYLEAVRLRDTSYLLERDHWLLASTSTAVTWPYLSYSDVYTLNTRTVMCVLLLLLAEFIIWKG